MMISTNSLTAGGSGCNVKIQVLVLIYWIISSDFLNDLFFVELDGNIANYADDNHLYNENACIKKLICDIENDSNVCLSWFKKITV